MIIGHNENSGEKPAKGLFRYLHHQAGIILANLVRIQPECFESLRKGEFPHRSVEVNPKAHRFTALALLGGSTPC